MNRKDDQLRDLVGGEILLDLLGERRKFGHRGITTERGQTRRHGLQGTELVAGAAGRESLLELGVGLV